MLESILDEYRANIFFFFCFSLSNLYPTYTGSFIKIALSGLVCSQQAVHIFQVKGKALTIRLSKNVLDRLVDCPGISIHSAPNNTTRVLTAVDTIGLLVGDLNAEFLLVPCQYLNQFPANPMISVSYLLNSHHNLNSVQAVQSEVVREVGSAVDL